MKSLRTNVSAATKQEKSRVHKKAQSFRTQRSTNAFSKKVFVFLCSKDLVLLVAKRLCTSEDL